MKDADPKSAHDITNKTDRVWDRWYQIGVVLGVSIGELEEILQNFRDIQDAFEVLTTILMYMYITIRRLRPSFTFYRG